MPRLAQPRLSALKAQKTASVSLTVKVSQELQGSGMQAITIVPGTIAL
jgi:hypothetical protein